MEWGDRAGRWQLKPVARRLFGKKKRDITDRCGRTVGIAYDTVVGGGGGGGKILLSAVEPK